jgi:hypothetical protein
MMADLARRNSAARDQFDWDNVTRVYAKPM